MVRGDGGPQRVDVEAEVRRAQGHRAPYAAGHLDAGDVGVVEGLQDDHLVTGVHEGQDRGGDRLGGAGGHQHLGGRVELDAVVPGLVRGDRVPQLGHAGPGRVLVVAGPQRLDRGLDDRARTVLVREALAEVHAAGAQRQRGHLGEDRRRDRLQASGHPGTGRGHRVHRHTRDPSPACCPTSALEPTSARATFEPPTTREARVTAMTDHDALLDQVTRKAVVHGRVTLSSGKEADYYVDLRRITLDAAGRAAGRPGDARPDRRLGVRRRRRAHAGGRPGRDRDDARRRRPGPRAGRLRRPQGRARRTVCSARSRAPTSPAGGCWPSRTPPPPAGRC